VPDARRLRPRSTPNPLVTDRRGRRSAKRAPIDTEAVVTQLLQAEATSRHTLAHGSCHRGIGRRDLTGTGQGDVKRARTAEPANSAVTCNTDAEKDHSGATANPQGPGKPPPRLTTQDPRHQRHEPEQLVVAEHLLRGRTLEQHIFIVVTPRAETEEPFQRALHRHRRKRRSQR